jgi:E3 ubiquitin-protein ligase CCNP1IP1
MEASLNCNVKQCGVQLSNQAVVTACRSVLDVSNMGSVGILKVAPLSHALCLDCASRHGFTGSGPYTCPVCRQPLIGGEIYKQVLQPSDEWKSVALCGLNPIVIMECAGRAVSFWSYQMANQMYSALSPQTGDASSYLA